MKWFRREAPAPVVASPAPEPLPPAGVWTVDGHWWRWIERDPAVALGPVETRRWAPDVYRCDRCGAESKVFQHEPKVWGVENGRHVARRCSGMRKELP